MGKIAHGFLALIQKTRILVVVLVLLLAGSTVFWLSTTSWTHLGLKPSIKAEIKNSNELASEIFSQAIKDSDGDGLKDWEEQVWTTDPKNPDSDNDGTLDGKEINQNHNPKKKGPNDTPLATISPQSLKTPDEENLTYSLAKSLLESDLLRDIVSDGEVPAAEAIGKLNLPDTLDANLLLGRAATIGTKDIVVTPTRDLQKIRNYFDAVSATYERHLLPQQGQGDLVILMTALGTKDYSKLSELDPIISALEQSITDIKRLAVPADYKNFAVRELNYLLQTKRALEIFRNTETDPLATALIVRRRIDLLSEMEQFHRDIQAELAAQGIAAASS